MEIIWCALDLWKYNNMWKKKNGNIRTKIFFFLLIIKGQCFVTIRKKIHLLYGNYKFAEMLLQLQ